MEESAPAQIERKRSLEVYRHRIERALSYVQENLSGEVSLDGAAAEACFSKYHFHRIFTAAIGESFSDYLRRLRLDRAAAFLEHNPSMSVTEIALASGFSSLSVLSRDFVARFGLPPSQWRGKKGAAKDFARSAEAGSTLNWFSSRRKGEEVGAELEDYEDRVELKSLGGLRFASRLHIGPYGEDIGSAWGRLGAWAGPRGLMGPQTRLVGISWDNPDLCPPESCRYSTCVPIPEGLEASGDISILAFPPRSYLSLPVRIPEIDFYTAYDILYRRFLPRSGLEPEDSPAIEFYEPGPRAAGRFEVELCLPVKSIY